MYYCFDRFAAAAIKRIKPKKTTKITAAVGCGRQYVNRFRIRGVVNNSQRFRFVFITRQTKKIIFARNTTTPARYYSIPLALAAFCVVMSMSFCSDRICQFSCGIKKYADREYTKYTSEICQGRGDGPKASTS